MLIINTACRFNDLPEPRELFETNCSHIDIAEKIDKLLKGGINKEVTTVNSSVVSRVGLAVAAGLIKNNEVEIRVFEKGKLQKTATYDENGYLVNWDYGFYLPDPIF